jgi:hypothetical protein
MNRHAHLPYAECPQTLEPSPLALHAEDGPRLDHGHTVDYGALTSRTSHSDVAVGLSMRLSREALRIVAGTDPTTGRNRATSARALVESASGRMLDPVQLKSFRKSPIPFIASEKRDH